MSVLFTISEFDISNNPSLSPLVLSSLIAQETYVQEALIGIAAPLSIVVQNQSDEML